jgi:hypothetical protein
MNAELKQVILHWAESIDSLRIIPRLFLTSCFAWTVWVSYVCLMWYFHLPSAERSLEASGFASVVFLTVFGFLKLVYTTYASTGRDWDSSGSTRTTMVSSTTEVKP